MARKSNEKKIRTFVVDFDDFCDATLGELRFLARLKEQYDDFKVTLYTIPHPDRTSDATIAAAKGLGDWVALAPHGWWHTRGESLAWTSEKTKKVIQASKERGIDSPSFRAPGWLLDGEVYVACGELGYTVASHSIYRIPRTGVAEYVYNDVALRKRGTRGIHGHLTPVAGNYIGDMDTNGSLTFGDKAKKRAFAFVHEAAIVEPTFRGIKV